jgi:hypothetical protein
LRPLGATFIGGDIGAGDIQNGYIGAGDIWAGNIRAGDKLPLYRNFTVIKNCPKKISETSANLVTLNPGSKGEDVLRRKKRKQKKSRKKSETKQSKEIRASCVQGCQMVYFQTKKSNLGKFWRVLQWKISVYDMAVWSILH